MALRMDMDLNIPPADKCSAKVISKFLLVPTNEKNRRDKRIL